VGKWRGVQAASGASRTSAASGAVFILLYEISSSKSCTYLFTMMVLRVHLCPSDPGVLRIHAKVESSSCYLHSRATAG
jgi:hypothetical protein